MTFSRTRRDLALATAACLATVAAAPLAAQDDPPADAPPADDPLVQTLETGTFAGYWEVILHEYTDPREEVHPEETAGAVIVQHGSTVQVFGRVCRWMIPWSEFKLEGGVLRVEAPVRISEDLPETVRTELESRRETQTFEARLAADGMTAEAFDEEGWVQWEEDEEGVARLTDAEVYKRPVTLRRIPLRARFVRIDVESEESGEKTVKHVGNDEPFVYEVIAPKRVEAEAPPFETMVAMGLANGMVWFGHFTARDTAEGVVYRSPSVRILDRRKDPGPPMQRDGANFIVRLVPGQTMRFSPGPPVQLRQGGRARPVLSDHWSEIGFAPQLQPRIQFFAIGSSGLRPIERLSLGVPVVAEVVYPEGREEATCEIRVRAGGEVLSLEAARVESDPTRYRTAPFLPWHADDGVGLPPPVPGELRRAASEAEADAAADADEG